MMKNCVPIEPKIVSKIRRWWRVGGTDFEEDIAPSEVLVVDVLA